MEVRYLLPLLFIAPAIAAEPPVNAGQAQPMDVFRLLDTDGNGLLTPRELRLIPALTLLYDRMDADNSGGIDFLEFRSLEPAGHPTITAGQQGLDFETLDANRDGKVDREEASALPPLEQRWSRFDSDNSNSIGPAEFSAFEAETLETTPAQPNFEQLDTNDDQLISQEEAVSDPRLVQRWLELDRDESGSLDPAEFARYEAESADDEGR